MHNVNLLACVCGGVLELIVVYVGLVSPILAAWIAKLLKRVL